MVGAGITDFGSLGAKTTNIIYFSKNQETKQYVKGVEEIMISMSQTNI